MRTPRGTAIALRLLAAAAASLMRIVDFDAPWHLAAGEAILRLRELPREDPFSYTSTRPWLIHEWLSEVLIALAHRAAGFPGVGCLQASAIAGTLGALIWARSRGGRDPLAGLAAVGYAAAAALLREPAAPRAQLFSTLLFATTLALCLRDEDAAEDAGGEGPRRELLLALPVGLLWAQIHGGNPNGVILLALLFLARPSRRHAAIAATAALLTCAGPYGARVHTHFLDAQDMLATIREWLPLSAALQVGSGAYVSSAAFLAAAAAALVARARAGERVSFEVLAFAAFTALALRYIRFTTEAVVVATAVLAPYLARVRVPLRARPLVLPAALALLAAAVAVSQRRLGFGFEPARFPVDAVAWLQRNHPPGPLFNGYNYGGYLLWAWPEQKVFIDGRNVTVYDPEFVAELDSVIQQPVRFLELERRYGFRVAVLQHRGGGADLFKWLRRRPSWRVVYADPVAAVLVRREPPPPAEPGATR